MSQPSLSLNRLGLRFWFRLWFQFRFRFLFLLRFRVSISNFRSGLVSASVLIPIPILVPNPVPVPKISNLILKSTDNVSRQIGSTITTLTSSVRQGHVNRGSRGSAAFPSFDERN